jgi:hypothetical protein
LELAAEGTLYGVSQGAGLWTLGPDDKLSVVLGDFHGLFTRREDGALVLAAADARDHRPRLELQLPEGKITMLAVLDQIEALAMDEDAVVVCDGAALRRVEFDGRITTLAEPIGEGLHGLVIGPDGPLVTVYHSREVVEVTADGTRRVLLTSEPPWAPTDVTLHDGALYVVEYAQHPCCWKGPRVRRVVEGESPVTLLTIDDQNHFHLLPWRLPLAILGAAMVVAFAVWGRSRRGRQVR